jgi:hypothetical protein
MSNIEVLNLMQGIKHAHQFIQLIKIVVFVKKPFVLDKGPGKIISEKYRSVVEEDFIHEFGYKSSPIILSKLVIFPDI